MDIDAIAAQALNAHADEAVRARFAKLAPAATVSAPRVVDGIVRGGRHDGLAVIISGGHR